MGASGWQYFVPYQPDIDRVLHDLRRDVLDRGAYEEPGVELEFLDEVGFFEADEDEREPMMAEFGLEPLRWVIDQVGIEGLRAWLESRQWSPDLRGPRPRPMEELEALQCLSMGGTHSILDIDGISPTRADGAIYPLPDDVLVSLFGTARPTRDIIEAWQGRDDPDRYGHYDRGQGFYVITYADGEPDEIYIEGASGD
jgi:hypothetical protein